MMYVLTQEELDELKTNSKSIKLENTEKLQKLCTMLANTTPVRRSWDKGEPKPWGCILNRSGARTEEGFMNPRYCDYCPVREICPHPNQNYSK